MKLFHEEQAGTNKREKSNEGSAATKQDKRQRVNVGPIRHKEVTVTSEAGSGCDGDDEFKLDAAAAAAEEAAAEEAAEDEEEEGAFKGKDKTALTADYVVRELDQETREDKHGSPTTVNWHGVTLSTGLEEIFVCANPENGQLVTAEYG
jgi:hypothetical protein